MTTYRARVAAMLGIQSNLASGSLHVSFRNAQNDVYIIDVPEHLVGGLVIGLTTAARDVPPKPGVSVQVMTLNSGRPFRLPDGRIGLELTIDDAFRLPLIFPKEAIAVLRKSLDELERQSSETKDGKPTVN